MSFFQNTPLVIQIFIYYNVLPKVGVRLGVVAIGVLGLALYTGAYAADIVRSAIKAVPTGQMEAAYSQGFSYLQTMRYIILPQAVKIGLPPMTNQAVNLIKNSSVLAVIAGGELMYRADSWSGSNLIYGPTFVMTGVLYLSICLPISLSGSLDGEEERAPCLIAGFMPSRWCSPRTFSCFWARACSTRCTSPRCRLCSA